MASRRQPWPRCLWLSFWHFVPYLFDPFNRHIPAPPPVRFSDLWLGWTASQGHRPEVVHELHQKYGTYSTSLNTHHSPLKFVIGTFVRLASNNVSIADPGFCDAFVSIHRRLFNTGDRADHARKRKIVSHICSQKSVLEFEPIARLYIARLLKQRD